MLSSFKQLLIWQKSVEFAVEIYHITQSYPKSELFGLTDQLRRAAVAIPSNIAEGYTRGYRKEYVQFLKIAYSSTAECETQLIISQKINYLSEREFNRLSGYTEEIMKMIYTIIHKLN